jgi:hypothetical protein
MAALPIVYTSATLLALLAGGPRQTLLLRVTRPLAPAQKAPPAPNFPPIQRILVEPWTVDFDDATGIETWTLEAPGTMLSADFDNLLLDISPDDQILHPRCGIVVTNQ